MSELDDLFFDEYDEDDDIDIVCQRCGADGLQWVADGEKWRLADINGAFHCCDAETATEGFERML